MPKFRLKSKEVEAVQHLGPQTLVVVGKKGEQRANPGDFILIDQPEDGSTPKPSDREVIPAKEFWEKYELVDGERESTDAAPTAFPGSPDDSGKTSVYGVPHFDSIEAAQQAATEHYTPTRTENGAGDTLARPASTTPFQCTLADDPRVYSIAPTGVVSQVAVVPADPTIDPGFGTGPGYQDHQYPSTLANAGGAVHDNPGPVSHFQTGTAAVDSPLTTFGNSFNPTDGSRDHRTEQPDDAEAARQKEDGVTQPADDVVAAANSQADTPADDTDNSEPTEENTRPDHAASSAADHETAPND